MHGCGVQIRALTAWELRQPGKLPRPRRIHPDCANSLAHDAFQSRSARTFEGIFPLVLSFFFDGRPWVIRRQASSPWRVFEFVMERMDLYR
jgi:hypothetical protein